VSGGAHVFQCFGHSLPDFFAILRGFKSGSRAEGVEAAKTDAESQHPSSYCCSFLNTTACYCLHHTPECLNFLT
jgi:hypothetical protein